MQHFPGALMRRSAVGTPSPAARGGLTEFEGVLGKYQAQLQDPVRRKRCLPPEGLDHFEEIEPRSGIRVYTSRNWSITMTREKQSDCSRLGR